MRISPAAAAALAAEAKAIRNSKFETLDAEIAECCAVDEGSDASGPTARLPSAALCGLPKLQTTKEKPARKPKRRSSAPPAPEMQPDVEGSSMSSSRRHDEDQVPSGSSALADRRVRTRK